MNQNKKLKDTDKQFLKEIALSIKEYQLIVSLLKRTPSKLELGLFGALGGLVGAGGAFSKLKKVQLRY